MILTDEQLRTTLRGAVEVAERDGHLAPLRFGRFVRETVYPEGNHYHPAMFHTSGVKAHFTTDSASLSFFYAVPDAAPLQSFDVTVNDILFSHTSLSRKAGRIEVALPAGEKRVTIYFPHHSAGQIYDVTLDDGASFAPVPDAKCRILALGDSITHGSMAGHASMTYPNLVARALGADVLNQGISGENFNPLAIDDAIAFTPDLVTVAYGTNDWSHTTRGVMVAAANGYFARLRDKYPKTPIVSILPVWRADLSRVTAVGTFYDAREIIKAAAARYDVGVIDGMELVPHVSGCYGDERLHPNDLGFSFYADGLLARLKRYME